MSFKCKVFYANIGIIGEFMYIPSPIFINSMHDGFFKGNTVTTNLFNLMVFEYLNTICFDIGSNALLYLNILPLVRR